MSKFSTPIVEIGEIEDHSGADRLEIVNVLGYQCVVLKDSWKKHDLAIYIPEGSLVPEWVMKQYGFWDDANNRGLLVGPDFNRVKALRLRGRLSQGILLPLSILSHTELTANKDTTGGEIANALGISKYEPPIPEDMAGDLIQVGGHTIKFDVEAWQFHPNAYEDGLEVVVTEKLHGTFCAMGFDPSLDLDGLYRGGTIIASKGFSQNGASFLNASPDDNRGTIYVNIWRNQLLKSGIWDRIVDNCISSRKVCHVLGEVFGPGVQDLHYGLKEKSFRVFALVEGDSERSYSTWNFVEDQHLEAFCDYYDLLRVPVLKDKLSLSKESIAEFVEGSTTFDDEHVREGVVISPVGSRSVVAEFPFLKWTGEGYLTRRSKNATEYN